jgi:hypothetical protein
MLTNTGALLTTPIQTIAPVLLAFEKLPFIVWLKSNALVYPALETIHITGIALVLGVMIVVDSRLLGLHRKLDLALVKSVLLPWVLVGFSICAITGLLMFASRASDLIANRAFVIKLILLMLAGTNAGILHTRGKLDDADWTTKMQALISLLIWLAVVTAGRWIAYT